MQFGAFLPYLVRKTVDRDTFLNFCRCIDEGPFTTLAHGERNQWYTLEHFTTLAAAAIATNRVRLMSHTLNLPMHPAAFVAKRTATIDVLSGGRYTMTAAIGGRPPDWAASERQYRQFPHAQMDGQIHTIRRLWAGEPPYEGAEPIRPAPLQVGGPPILCASQGPKGLARSAKWADGYAGFIGEKKGPKDTEEFLRADAARIRQAWTAAGRTEAPYLSTSCFFGLGPDAKERLGEVGAQYRKNRDPNAAADDYWVNSPAAVREMVAAAGNAGFEHLIFITTTDDIRETEELAGILQEFV